MSPTTPAVEQALSRTIGERVTIGGIRAGWHGCRPELDLTDLRSSDREGRMVLAAGVDATVSWASFVYASIHFTRSSSISPISRSAAIPPAGCSSPAWN
jgi:uncharacterized protein YhdP